MPPAGLPEAFLEAGEDPLGFLLVRFARGRGPFTTAEAVARFGPNAEEGLARLEAEDRLVRGEIRPGGTEREWCDPDVLRRLRRASLARLRRQVEPTGQSALARFLPAWQGGRPPRNAARGARPAPGDLAAGRAVGVGRPAAPRARLPARAARPALRVRRGRLGRRGARARGAVLPRGRSGAGPARARCRRPTGDSAPRRFAPRSPRARSSGSTSCKRPGSTRSMRCPRSGISSGRAKRRTTRGRRSARAAGLRRRRGRSVARDDGFPAPERTRSPRRRDAGR